MKRQNSSQAPGLAAWEQWAEHLATRRRPRPMKQLIKSKRCQPLLWAWPQDVRDGSSHQLILALERLRPGLRQISKRLAGDLETWLDSARGRTPHRTFALESLAWAHALPLLAQLLPASPWTLLLEQLQDISRDAAGADLSTDPLTQQLLAGELPFTLAYLFPELPACRELAEAGASTLSTGLVDLLDGEGTIHSRYLTHARPLLACWTRCHYLGQAAQQPCFNVEAQEQFKWYVGQCMRASRSDGSALLSGAAATDWSPTLFEAALNAVGDSKDRAIARCLLPGHGSPTVPRMGKVDASLQSEWAQFAVLRRIWKRSAEQVAVAYHDRAFQIELNRGGQRLLAGTCETELQVNGHVLKQESEWEDVCWQADERVVYLELEGRFADGWKLHRQVLLCREDRCLLLSDAVLGDEPAALSYRHILPLPAGVTWEPARETREGHLSIEQSLAAVIPLHLPEWRAERGDGALTMAKGGLELQSSAHAQRLYAPLFIDLDPHRSTKQLTWRRLTVGERLESVPHDTAVGFRIQIGRQQWLVYRSLAPRTGRTLLGQNFSSEFVCGRFARDGTTEKLLEIE